MGDGYRACRKCIRFLDGLLDRAFLLAFLLLFLCGGYALYDSYMVYGQAADGSLQKYKPGSGDAGDTDKEIEGFMACWIEMDGTDIDYPVMQGADNSEYLSRDPFGEYSLAGSIFLDARNDPSFLDPYSLVYGHHMEHGLMFGALDAWLDRSYFNGHLTGRLLFADGRTEELSVFAILEVDGAEGLIFAPGDHVPADVLSFVREKAVIYRSEDAPVGGERFMALSTCKFPDTAERTVLFCRMGVR